jgi:glutathione synthase/RimK-type ligase-like ATP-grasp enzyme
MNLERRFSRQKIYIAKPSPSSLGKGIVLANKFSDIQQLPKDEKVYIVQEYISKPLLIENTKFDLRLYVLITGLRPYTAYICKEGMARFCT